MKKVLFSLMIATLLTACGEKTEQGKTTITLGVTMPLTGDAAEAGQAAKAGLEMVLDELKQKNLKYDYKLVFEDNQMNPMKTANNVKKLISVDKADAIFSMWNMMSNVTASMTAEQDVFSFACSYGRTANAGKYAFNMQNTYEDEAKLLVDELKKRNTKTVAMFIDNGTITEQFAVVEDYIKNQSNIEIVFKEYFNPGEKDYKAAIIKASAKNPELYIISGYPPSPYLFIKQLKEITGRSDNVTSIDAIAEIDMAHRNVANNLWYIDSNQNGLDAFQERLLEKKNMQSQSCVGNVASNLEIFVNAVENAELEIEENKPSKENIRQWIFDNVKDYETASGKATVLDDGFIAVKPSVRMIKNGKSVAIEENK